MVQMIISTPQLAERLPAVVWNYEEVKAGVERALAQYKDRVYTADMIGGAKADRAGLNKLADAIAAKRREVKAWYLEPFQAFENQCKEVEGMIADASGEIDGQVKAFEAAEKDAKRAALAAYYDQTAGELREMVPVTALFNPKWLNKSYRLESAKIEIDAAVQRIREGLDTIRTTCGADVAACMDVFLHEGLDLSAAIRKHQQLEKVRAAEAQRAAQKEQQALPQKLADLRSSLTGEPAPGAEVTLPAGAAPEEAAPLPAERPYMDFRVYYESRAQLMGLRQYMIDQNIQFGRVPAAQ